MKTLVYLLLISFYLTACSEKEHHYSQPAKLSEFEFKGVFGTHQSDSTIIYLIQGTGFFRAPRSNNSDSLISQWMINHPEAIVTPISSISEGNHRMVYCMIIDQKDTLNNYLIKEGCFPGGTMMRMKTLNEMSLEEKALIEDIDGYIDIEELMESGNYENFIEQIRSAEVYAQKNNKGIWSNDYPKNRIERFKENLKKLDSIEH